MLDAGMKGCDGNTNVSRSRPEGYWKMVSNWVPGRVRNWRPRLSRPEASNLSMLAGSQSRPQKRTAGTVGLVHVPSREQAAQVARRTVLPCAACVRHPAATIAGQSFCIYHLADTLGLSERTHHWLAADEFIRYPADKLDRTVARARRDERTNELHAASEGHLKHRPPHVLVIAQKRAVRLWLGSVLRREHIDFSAVGGGHQALLAARKCRPDLVVMALPLRVLSPETTIQALRMEFGSSLHVLALSIDPQSDATSALEAYAVLGLPLDAGEFAARVKQGLLLSKNPIRMRRSAQPRRSVPHARKLRSTRLVELT